MNSNSKQSSDYYLFTNHRSSIFMPMNKEQEVFCMELQLQNLSKQYGDKCAVGNVSVSLKPGVYGLLGAKGA